MWSAGGGETSLLTSGNHLKGTILKLLGGINSSPEHKQIQSYIYQSINES